jgi:polar amino acid transport system substrate-binding protein
MLRRLTYVTTAALAALAITMLAAGCGSSSSSSSTGKGNDLGLLSPGTLTVGSDIPYPPFEQGHPPDYTGFDIDMVDEIAKRLHLQPKIIDTSFNTIFSDEQAGKFDLVASATTITPARAKRVAFSTPYFDAGQTVMVQKGSPIQSVSDITSGDTVGVQQGTTGEEYAKQHTDATVQSYPEIGNAFNALNNGQIDAVINDYPVNLGAEKKYPQLTIVGDQLTGEKYGFAMQQQNTALQDAVNGALKDMIADGTYEKIFEKWFPGKPTADFLPKKG